MRSAGARFNTTTCTSLPRRLSRASSRDSGNPSKVLGGGIGIENGYVHVAGWTFASARETTEQIDSDRTVRIALKEVTHKRLGFQRTQVTLCFHYGTARPLLRKLNTFIELRRNHSEVCPRARDPNRL